MVENAAEVGEGLLLAEVAHETAHFLPADARGTHHRPEVAVEQMGSAGVEHEETPQTVVDLPAARKLHHRQADALVEDLGGGWIVGACRSAADVGLMRAVAGEGDERAIDDHRPGDDPIGQMVAAGNVRIAQDEDVSFGDVAAEHFQQRSDRKASSARVDGNAIGLRYERAICIGDEAGEVVGLVEDRAARGAHHHPAHLAGDMIEAVLHQRQRDRIESAHDLGPSNSMR